MNLAQRSTKRKAESEGSVRPEDEVDENRHRSEIVMVRRGYRWVLPVCLVPGGMGTAKFSVAEAREGRHRNT